MKLIFILFLSFISSCLSAIEGCEAEISENHCIKCQNGWYLTTQTNTGSTIPNVICAQYKIIQNCQTQVGDKCFGCSNGYYLNEQGECSKCNDGCDICTSSTCLVCSVNQQMRKDKKREH